MHLHLVSAFGGLSVQVAVFSAWTALDLFQQVRERQGPARLVWLATAALALGGGVWAMHFIALLGVDPERARATPFGGTIAHGFLTLSLASAMAEAVEPLDGVVMGVNYGFDKLRFLAPVRSGSRVRGRFKLMSAEDKGSQDGVTRWLLKHELTVEIDGGDKPALTAEWLSMQMVKV